MKCIKIGSLLLCLVLMTVLQTRCAYAIDNTPVWQGVDFDFSQPGARSRGIGSAFVGIADDTTAAVTNPAGLIQLPEMQISLEGRTVTKDSSTVSWAAGEPEGSIRHTDKTDLSYFSFSMPIKLDEHLSITVALFYNKLTNMETDVSLDAFPTEINKGFLKGFNLTFPEYSAKNDVEINQYGVSFGTGFLENKLMLGAGISFLQLDLDSEFSQSGNVQVGFEDKTAKETVTSHDSSIDAGFRFGLLYSPTKKLILGASAMLMPKIDYEANYNTIKNLSFNEKTGRVDIEERVNEELTQSISVPDNYSFGLSYRVTDKFTLFAEAKYIEYSDLMDGFDSIWRSFYDFGGMANGEGRYDIDDIWEFHMGAEYVLDVWKMPLALRVGSYYEPAHSLEFDASDIGKKDVESLAAAQAMADLMDGGDDTWHFTFGIGTVFFNKYQFDVAADISERGEESSFITSMVYAF